MEKYTELPIEIDAERLMQFPAGRYLAVDMRDEYSCGYGMLDGAVRVGEDELREFLENGEALPAMAQAMEECIPIVLYCKYGRISLDAAEAFREKGYGNFCSLKEADTGPGLSRKAAGRQQMRSAEMRSKKHCARHSVTT